MNKLKQNKILLQCVACRDAPLQITIKQKILIHYRENLHKSVIANIYEHGKQDIYSTIMRASNKWLTGRFWNIWGSKWGTLQGNYHKFQKTSCNLIAYRFQPTFMSCTYFFTASPLILCQLTSAILSVSCTPQVNYMKIYNYLSIQMNGNTSKSSYL